MVSEWQTVKVLKISIEETKLKEETLNQLQAAFVDGEDDEDSKLGRQIAT